ncbi:MAG: hypothetical protein FWD19_04445 [Defluviitaleaceae bacterium]|nr:hypothetical protein [Defluviitaleaceae bacterium]
MEKTALHTFEMAGEKTGGFLGFGGTKPMLSIFDDGFGWPEGKEKKFVPFSSVKQLKYNKYYSTVTIVFSETKRIPLLNIQIFEMMWADFSRKKNLTLKLIAE